VRTIRTLADRSANRSAASRRSTPTNSARLQLADFAERLGRIYEIRFEIYQRQVLRQIPHNMINPADAVFFFRTAAIW